MDKDKIKDLILTLVDLLDDDEPDVLLVGVEDRLRAALAVAATDSQSRDAALSERITALARRLDKLEARRPVPAGGRVGIEDSDAG